MKHIIRAAGICVAFCTAFGGTAFGEIVIGTAGPMSGQYAEFGEQMRRGAEAAVAKINENGGVLGEPLILVVRDDACDPKQAIQVAEEVASEGVVFMAGHFCSGSSIPASEIYEDRGIIQITPASTNPVLTQLGRRNVFRVINRDDYQGILAGEYIAAHYRDDTVAVINDESLYGQGLAYQVINVLEAQGIEEIVYEEYISGLQDYGHLVSLLEESSVDVVYLGGYHEEAGVILREMRDRGISAQLIAGDALISDDFWAITGEFGEGVMVTFGPDPRQFESAAEVVAQFRQSEFEPAGYTLHTYAAVQVFAQAAEIAGTTEPSAVIEALQVNVFDTVLGAVSFDENGDLEQQSYVLVQWNAGTYAEFSAHDVPEFPWPPPSASGREVLSLNYFNQLTTDGSMTFGQVADYLELALDLCGYFEVSYYGVPGGFAMVTRLEQINEDGTPSDGDQRWSVSLPRRQIFSLSDYIDALFSARVGYYRVIVFVVTGFPVSSSEEIVRREDAVSWLVGGLYSLPDFIRALQIEENASVMALIYEFTLTDYHREARLIVPGRLQGRVHLDRSGLWGLLSR